MRMRLVGQHPAQESCGQLARPCKGSRLLLRSNNRSRHVSSAVAEPTSVEGLGDEFSLAKGTPGSTYDKGTVEKVIERFIVSRDVARPYPLISLRCQSPESETSQS